MSTAAIGSRQGGRIGGTKEAGTTFDLHLAVEQRHAVARQRAEDVRQINAGILAPEHEAALIFDMLRDQRLSGVLGGNPGIFPGERLIDVLPNGAAVYEADDLFRGRTGESTQDILDRIDRRDIHETDVALAALGVGVAVETALTSPMLAVGAVSGLIPLARDYLVSRVKGISIAEAEQLSLQDVAPRLVKIVNGITAVAVAASGIGVGGGVVKKLAEGDHDGPDRSKSGDTGSADNIPALIQGFLPASMGEPAIVSCDPASLMAGDGQMRIGDTALRVTAGAPVADFRAWDTNGGVLVSNGEVTAGSFVVGKDVYSIRSLQGNDRCEVTREDVSGVKPDAHIFVKDPGVSNVSLAQVESSSSQTVTLDMGAYYTAELIQALGGEAYARAETAWGIAMAQQLLEASDVTTVTLRTVYLGPMPDPNFHESTDWGAMWVAFLDSSYVHTIVAMYGLDTNMLNLAANTQFCGLSPIRTMTYMVPFFEVGRSNRVCELGAQVTGHELSHNAVGAGHNSGDFVALAPYDFGYKNEEVPRGQEGFQTVPSSPCATRYCPPPTTYSNPDLYDDLGRRQGDPEIGDVARAFREFIPSAATVGPSIIPLDARDVYVNTLVDGVLTAGVTVTGGGVDGVVVVSRETVDDPPHVRADNVWTADGSVKARVRTQDNRICSGGAHVSGSSSGVTVDIDTGPENADCVPVFMYYLPYISTP